MVRRGQHTVFGEGVHVSELVRSLYYAILTTHTVLAAIVAPLALYTASLALRGRFDRHVRIARWTLPIWLYVSITGVIVYLMLYRLYPSPEGPVQ